MWHPSDVTPVKIDPNRPGPARFGIPASAWPRIVRLASEYHAGWDWPDGSPPVPPRLAFLRWLISRGIVREDR